MTTDSMTQVCVCCNRRYRAPRPRARGLSSVCYNRRRRDGTLTDYPRLRVQPFREWFTDYRLLRSTGVTRDQVAQRLQMTRTAIDRALVRHEVPVTLR